MHQPVHQDQDMLHTLTADSRSTTISSGWRAVDLKRAACSSDSGSMLAVGVVLLMPACKFQDSIVRRA